MSIVQRVLHGNGLFARAARGSAWAATGHIANQFIRLASNLILTRLLFPEAFGLMSLVTVLSIGVTMLSDMGIGVSVSQSNRGDEPTFLHTAWTLQVLRGISIWVIICLLTWPMSQIYGQASLLFVLPVTSFSIVLAGFNSINIETASRHMLLGRVTVIDLISQTATVVFTVILAWLTGSVWALVAGNLVGAAVKLALSHMALPGGSSKFAMDKACALELVHFGKWIIPSSVFGFLVAQGDRLILGVYLSLQLLGVYNIGQFLGAAPIVLSGAVTARILVPLYREFAERPTLDNAKRLRILRFALTSAIMSMMAFLAFLAHPLISVMYDSRYDQSAAILVLVVMANIPVVLGLTYDRSALAAGDSRSFFYVIAFRGILLSISFVIGAEIAGLVGALVAQAIASAIGHTSLIWLARKHQVWDPLHDVVFAAIGIAVCAISWWLNWPQMVELLQL